MCRPDSVLRGSAHRTAVRRLAGTLKIGPMKSLAQPEVLKSAISAAALSALVCLPRLVLWPTRRYPLWYLDALLFLGGTVLWAFVFAWHTQYTGLPAITGNVQRKHFQSATVSGVLLAIVLRLFLDPT